MMINCPRCNAMVSDDVAHCIECGYSIMNYLENKKLSRCSTSEGDSSTTTVMLTENKVNVTEEKDNNVEDNILKFLSNIKIVKDESYDPKDDELDNNMHKFLVEALNDSYKIRSVTTVIKNPKEYLGLEDEQVDSVQKIKKEVSDNLKLEEPENVENLELVELTIDLSKDKKEDAKDNKETTSSKDVVNNRHITVKKNNNLELNTHELEIIHKRKIKLPEEFEMKNGIIVKEIPKEMNYDKFYETISALRKDKFNNNVILTVASATGIFVVIVALISELIIR